MLNDENNRMENCFYWEESSVKLSGAPEDLNKFKQYCNTLRESVCAAWACKQSGEKVNSATFATCLLAIKELNRRSQFRIKKAREQTTEQKLGVDKLHLDLQNFLYEVAHLENEIKTCLEFKSEHEKLKLIPVQEFCQATGRNASTVATHEGTLERLYWELEQRKKLSRSLEELKREVEAVSRQIQEKRDYLSSFAPKLKELYDSTIPVQELMEVPFTREEEQYKRVALLAPPLYMLYAYMKSYISSSGRTDLLVDIEGDAELARAVNQTAPQPDGNNYTAPDLEDSDVDADSQEGTKHSHGRHKRKTGLAPHQCDFKSKAASAHPLVVVLCLARPLTLEGDSPTINVQLRLIFTWLIDLKLVTVRMMLQPEANSFPTHSSSGDDLLHSEQLLSKLDWLASETTMSADSPVMSSNHTHQWDACQPIGRPYVWAQRLCGFHCLLNHDPTNHRVNSGGDSSVTVGSDAAFGQLDAWLRVLERRLHDRIVLINELVEIEKHRPSVSAKQRGLLPPNTLTDSASATQLMVWKRATFEQLKLVARAQVPISLDLIQPEDAIFQCEFGRDGVSSAIVWIALPSEYPHKAPFFVLEQVTPLPKSASVQSFDVKMTDLHLQDLEYEVNCFWSEFFPTHDRVVITNVALLELWDSNILSCQLTRLASCLDALCINGTLTDSARPTTTDRCVKYPTRTRPLRYLPSLGAFTYR